MLVFSILPFFFHFTFFLDCVKDRCYEERYTTGDKLLLEIRHMHSL